MENKNIEIPKSNYVQSREDLEKLVSAFKEVDGMRRIRRRQDDGFPNKDSNNPEGIYKNTVLTLDKNEILLSPQLLTDFTRELATNSALLPNYNNTAYFVSGYDTTPFFLSGLVTHFHKQHPDKLATLDIRGLKEKRIKYIGNYVENANIEIVGDVGEEVGWGAKNSTFMIYGNTGEDPASDSEFSRVFIFGDINGRCPGSAYFSQVFVDGKIHGTTDPQKATEKILEGDELDISIFNLATELYQKSGEQYIKVWPIVSDKLEEKVLEEIDSFFWGDNEIILEDNKKNKNNNKGIYGFDEVLSLIQDNGRNSLKKMLYMANEKETKYSKHSLAKKLLSLPYKSHLFQKNP